MSRPRHALASVFVTAILLACGSSQRSGFGDDAPPGGLGGGPGLNGPNKCVDGRTCVGVEIHTCTAEGGLGDKIGECIGGDEACIDGKCAAGCQALDQSPSNVGCEFWAVDLDNTVDPVPNGNAAGAPWGVVIANPGGAPADVTIEQNDAEPGQPRQLSAVQTLTIPSGQVQTVTMPTREVDGSLQGNNEGAGTVLSSRAFRITSSAPVVVYQLNALAQAFSNDGSLLIPKGGLGLVHRVLSYPTAYAAAAPIIGARRAYITVIGTQEGTAVTIKTSTPTLAAPGYPAVPKGGEVSVTLGPFDVFNLESDGNPGDFTGSTVVADKPVAVFTGTEMSVVPGVGTNIPEPPGGGDTCCLDHLEEQLFPVESYGKRFVISHSAVRSTGGWIEPDVIRFMGVAAEAAVKTNLPAPFDAFTLAPGQMLETYAQTDFVVESSEPIAIAQILVAQRWISGPAIGDPSLTIFPAIDQFRRNYLFSVPTSWDTNAVVVSMPVGAKITIDGNALDLCVVRPAGTIGGVAYETRTCRLSEGPHSMAGDMPFGIAAYGYGNAGSYAFVGGANITKIYAPPPFPN